MGTKDPNHLQQIKLKLAEKYDRLSRTTQSSPKRKKFKNRAERYRRQAARIAEG